MKSVGMGWAGSGRLYSDFSDKPRKNSLRSLNVITSMVENRDMLKRTSSL